MDSSLKKRELKDDYYYHQRWMDYYRMILQKGERLIVIGLPLERKREMDC